MAAFGLLLIFGGFFRLAHGVLVVINWRYQPIYSGALVGSGVLVVLMVLIPLAWLEWVVARGVGRR
jgi:hypothetical protein